MHNKQSIGCSTRGQPTWQRVKGQANPRRSMLPVSVRCLDCRELRRREHFGSSTRNPGSHRRLYDGWTRCDEFICSLPENAIHLKDRTHRGCIQVHYARGPMVAPPSQTMVCPVTRSEPVISDTTAAATSSGEHTLPNTALDSCPDFAVS